MMNLNTGQSLLESYWYSEAERTCFRHEEPTGERYLRTRLTDEVRGWVDENCGPGVYVSHCAMHVRIEFLSPAEAVAFKVRWG
ncbi:MAG: hypothetical protein EOO38_06490 [Cytophagaceae bacterium]|nr:MAG: hypothetical protein EOO38_06490 [Cytophagaceae bacterium]